MSDQSLFNRPFIGYDGSKSCHDLITVFKRMHPKFEASSFVFVWDPMKNYIPPPTKGPGIEKELRQKTEGLQNIDIKLVQKEVGSAKSTNEYILEQLFKSKSSFLMLGFYGSKGEKVRSIDLSSRIRRFVYDSKTTVAVIKEKDKGTNAALFCCDGSEISYDGLKKAAIFCKKFNYTLTVLHCYEQQLKTYSKQVKNELKQLQQSIKETKFQILVQKSPLIDSLTEKAKNYDWIILTKNGYRGQISKKVFIGSNTTDVLTLVQCNLLIL